MIRHWRAQPVTNDTGHSLKPSQADFVTLHVPLTLDGPDATFHLIGTDELARMATSSILINTARGEVVDNAALLEALTGRTIGGAVMDVWEGEPSINWDLLNHVTLGTPHVAGYSSDAKINGTVMMYHACCRFWGMKPAWTPPPDLPTTLAPGPSPHLAFDATGKDFQTLAHDIITTLYNLPGDHARMQDVLAVPEPLRPQAFDLLRERLSASKGIRHLANLHHGRRPKPLYPITNIGNPRQ